MSNEIRKCELHPVRLDSDVWAAVKALPTSLNIYLRNQLRVGLKKYEGDVFSPEIEKRIAAQVKPRKSKKDRIVAELAASDLTAQQVGREDIEYGLHTELPRGEHVAQLDAVARPAGSTHGKATVETWRQDRKPIPKPRDRK